MQISGNLVSLRDALRFNDVIINIQRTHVGSVNNGAHFLTITVFGEYIKVCLCNMDHTCVFMH